MLNDIFEPFGRVVSCHVQRDGAGSSKGLGTVVVCAFSVIIIKHILA